jgi:putative DNA primase/helicase
LLNTPAGVVDLRTGRIRAHRADDYMTKITAAGPRGDCPLFLRFLDRIMAGDKELIAYIRRVFGYCLTGITREHALFFGHGSGGNGKGVLKSTFAGLMGDYHKTAPIQTFTASYGDRHSTDVASLCGARLVTASETEEGRHWDEAKVKLLTGGDQVSARFMRQDDFQFTPAFKLFIDGNHQPALKSVDEAIRRRLQMIPFAVTIPPDERDGELTEKLKAEWPGILRWAIDGCLQWQTEGLRPPRAVKATTDEYMEAQDTFSAWIADRCERKPDAWSGSTALFQSWSSWARDAGEDVGSQMKLSAKLKKVFAPKAQNTGNGFLGLRIRPRN